jgi:hypothetical protein
MHLRAAGCECEYNMLRASASSIATVQRPRSISPGEYGALDWCVDYLSALYDVQT